MEVEEQDPFVDMILKYENEKQLELFD